jgi:TolB protein
VWIPGRRALLFISNREGGRDIYQVDLKRSGRPQRAANRITTGLNPERLSLSTNGRRLAWSVLTQTSNVWSIAIPGRDSVPLSRARQVTSGTQNIENAVVSSDGWLYYDSDRSGNFDIWRIPLAGGQPQQLTTDPADDFAPDPSPDGKQVAFHSTRNGVNNRDIFVMPVGGRAAVQVSTSPGDDRGPNWSPDGRFLSWGDNYSDSGVLLVEQQPGGGWSAPRRFLGHGGDSWSADGRFSIFDSLGMHLVDAVTGGRSLLLSPRAIGGPGFPYSVLSTDLRTVYAPRVDSTGRFSIVAFPVGGETSRTLVYADNPLAQQHRYGLAVSGGRFYVPVLEAKMDVWVAEVR